MSRRYRLRLYLDVDGVLNAESPRWGDTAVITVKTSGDSAWTKRKVTYSPALFAALAAAADQFDIEIVWLTTWLEDGSIRDFVIATGGALGGGRWLTIPRRGGTHGELPGDWKLKQILEDISRNPTPFIWADDDEVPFHGASVAAIAVLPSLMLAPLMVFGLEPKHIDAIRNFAASPHTYSV